MSGLEDRGCYRVRTWVTIIWLLLLFALACAVASIAINASYSRMLPHGSAYRVTVENLFIPLVGTVALLSFWKNRAQQITLFFLGEVMTIGGAALDVLPDALFLVVELGGLVLVLSSCFSIASSLLTEFARLQKQP
jgi:hypothetical protein